MATDTVVPTEHELKGIQLSHADTIDLIRQAQESDAADRLLTVFQALKKYKKAVFWAMFLSTSLIMEGYDLVIVSNISQSISFLFLFLFLPPISHKRADCADGRHPDQFILRSNPVSKPLWSIRPCYGEKAHSSIVAIRLVELVSCRPAGGAPGQRLHPRSFRLSTHHDVFHDLDGGDDFHSRLCTLLANFSMGRINVWCFMGSFPGTTENPPPSFGGVWSHC